MSRLERRGESTGIRRALLSLSRGRTSLFERTFGAEVPIVVARRSVGSRGRFSSVVPKVMVALIGGRGVVGVWITSILLHRVRCLTDVGSCLNLEFRR
jgi:hypothetical protein